MLMYLMHMYYKTEFSQTKSVVNTFIIVNTTKQAIKFYLSVGPIFNTIT